MNPQPNADAAGCPRVSVIIPVKNAAQYLAEAIESALVQTCAPAEVLVVDDGSTDASMEVARRFGNRVRVLEGAPGGIGATRNRGVTRAAGDFLAFLDADDYWVPDKLARQVVAFAQEPALDAVFGEVRQFYSPDIAVDDAERERMSRTAYAGHHAGTMLIRTLSFLRVGPFAESVKVGEFLDWYARGVELELRFHSLPDVVMFRRIHRNNTVVRQRASQTDYARILKAVLDRRRQNGRLVQSGVHE